MYFNTFSIIKFNILKFFFTYIMSIDFEIKALLRVTYNITKFDMYYKIWFSLLNVSPGTSKEKKKTIRKNVSLGGPRTQESDNFRAAQYSKMHFPYNEFILRAQSYEI